ncbi:MAG: hypothetical protein ACFFAN_08335 [Promethearchaeota archaeon]
MIDKISIILNSISPKWACVLSNGTIVETTLGDKSLGKVIRILKSIINKTSVKSVVIFNDLVIYRPTFDFFIFIMGRIPRNVIKEKFAEISLMYKDIDQEYKKKTKIKKIEVELILFSMSMEEGPKPIYYIPNEYDEDLAFKICMKSMLLLSVESRGATNVMISILPFVDLEALGIVYTFQIIDNKARGGAYDSAIIILVDYKFRALIYEKYLLIEKHLNNTKEKLIEEYFSPKKEYKKLLNALRENLNKITFESIESEDIKAEMMEEIKKLTKL